MSFNEKLQRCYMHKMVDANESFGTKQLNCDIQKWLKCYLNLHRETNNMAAAAVANDTRCVWTVPRIGTQHHHIGWKWLHASKATPLPMLFFGGGWKVCHPVLVCLKPLKIFATLQKSLAKFLKNWLIFVIHLNGNPDTVPQWWRNTVYI